MFLMPSRYEPCGLGQMIAMRYGSVPVVRRTGGLADTVPDADEHPEGGRGFAFNAANGEALAGALRRALAAFEDTKRWRQIQLAGMNADLSWNEAAGRYLDLYTAARERGPLPRVSRSTAGS
jgi:starch synthase